MILDEQEMLMRTKRPNVDYNEKGELGKTPIYFEKISETRTWSGTKDIFHQPYSKIQHKLFYGQACFSHQNGKVDDILYLICFFF